MSTIDERWNIVDPTRAFCQKVLPLVYDESLSYMEMVCKMSTKVNELIENNNNLPEYIHAEIETKFNNYINSEDFKNMIIQYIMKNYNYIGVKWYGAIGDGEHDDTSAIQNVIDDFNGFTIFLQKGKYKITSPLLLPNNTIIKGCGYNSEIFSVENINLIKSKDYDNFIITQPQINLCNIHLENFALNGLLFSDTENRVRSGKISGSGLLLYGNSFTLKNLFIYNMPEYGIVLNNVASITKNPNPELFYEQIISDCKVSLNGKDGIITHNIYDFVVDKCTINTSGQMNDGNKYANLRVTSGNIKMSNTHLSSLYGTIYPEYSLYLANDSRNNEIVNSHIEGASLPLYCGGTNLYITNSSIYNTVGEFLVELANSLAFFDNVFLGVQAIVPINQPEFKAAFKYTNSPRGNKINVVLQGCKLDTDTSTLGYLNEFNVKGFCNNEDITEPDLAKADYNLSGDFSPLITTKNNRNMFYFDGLPSIKYPNFIAIDGDITMSSPFIYVGDYKTGTLNLTYSVQRGAILVIINNTDKQIPFTSNININGLKAGVILPHHNAFLICVDENNAVGNID